MFFRGEMIVVEMAEFPAWVVWSHAFSLAASLADIGRMMG